MITFMDATEGGEQTRSTEECAFSLRFLPQKRVATGLNDFPTFVHVDANFCINAQAANMNIHRYLRKHEQS